MRRVQRLLGARQRLEFDLRAAQEVVRLQAVPVVDREADLQRGEQRPGPPI